jgi:methyl-accepting chemotaxis protein
VGAGTWDDEFMKGVTMVQEVNTQSRYIMTLVVLGCLVLISVLWLLLSRAISAPLVQVTGYMRASVEGNSSQNVSAALLQRQDEIGNLAQSAQKLIEGERVQAELCEKVAQGDWTQRVQLRSDHDVLGKSLQKMIDQVNQALQSIQVAAEQVHEGSTQIADASQALSQGATESAASIEQIGSSLTEIGGQTKLNAENAQQANQLAGNATLAAQTGNEQMQAMTEAMGQIHLLQSANNQNYSHH